MSTIVCYNSSLMPKIETSTSELKLWDSSWPKRCAWNLFKRPHLKIRAVWNFWPLTIWDWSRRDWFRKLTCTRRWDKPHTYNTGMWINYLHIDSEGQGAEKAELFHMVVNIDFSGHTWPSMGYDQGNNSTRSFLRESLTENCTGRHAAKFQMFSNGNVIACHQGCRVT